MIKDSIPIIRKHNLPTNKKDIISILDQKTRQIAKERNEFPVHTLPYYKAILLLLNKVILEIATRNIFSAPEGWYYSFNISNIEAALYLRHLCNIVSDENSPNEIIAEYDESFRLISYPVPLLSVEEYASKNKIEQVTVRQWIRRGKLRTAVKIGGEWRISELTDLPTRGYTSVRYYNNGRLFKLPSNYKCFNQQPLFIDILPSKEKKGYCQILLDGIPAKLSGELIPDSEREKIELSLISTDGMKNSTSNILNLPDIMETDTRGIKIRSGRMKLPQNWDTELYGRRSW